MKKFTFNKRLIKSNYPPQSNVENILWVEVNNAGEVIYVREFDKGDWKIILQKPRPEIVDLGIELEGKKLYFAKKNLGASNPKDPGMYFAWGETEGHYVVDGKIIDDHIFNKENYKLYSNGDIIKYNDTDKLRQLLPEDDAATVLLGKEWRTPTPQEFRALIVNTQTSKQDTSSILECFLNCKDSITNTSFVINLYQDTEYNLSNPSFSTKDTSTIVEGITFKSKVTKEELYLPCAGFCSGQNIINSYEGRYEGRAMYMSSYAITSYASVTCLVISLLGASNIGDTDNRFYGIHIRPIYDN